MYKENITAEEIAAHELSWFKGEIVLVDNLKTFYQNFPRLLGSDLLGFDTETRPTFKKGRKNSVSLIQLSTGDLACLFRINKIGIPDELAHLLCDPLVTKAGVAVHDDIKFLKCVRKFNPAGFLDLQTFEKNFKVYPNPTKDKINIAFGSLQYKMANLEITSILGKFISSDTYHNLSNATIDLKNNSKGIYI